MVFEQVELHGASIITKADIGKGRSAVIVGLDAPLTSEAAAALGSRALAKNASQHQYVHP